MILGKFSSRQLRRIQGSLLLISRSKFTFLDKIYGGKQEGIKPEFSAFVSDRWWLTWGGIRQYMRDRDYARFKEREREDYRNILEALGGNAEIACAHWIIDRGGAIRFEGDVRWHYAYKSDESVFRIGRFAQKSQRLRLTHAGALPNTDVAGLYVEAIDFSKRPRLTYNSFDALVDLHRLRFLRLRNSDVDDFALGRLASSSRLANSLLYLDISKCARVTERGIAALVNLRTLKKLDIRGCELVEHPELLAALLECDLNGLVVETDEAAPLPRGRSTPANLQSNANSASGAPRKSVLHNATTNVATSSTANSSTIASSR